MQDLRVLAEHASFGGTQGFYAHPSRECGSEMRFAVYQPPAAKRGKVPTLVYLAGLTCTEETFPIKAGAQRVAGGVGMMLIAPDTSPRQVRHPGDDESWDFGLGAGFYVDATQAPWSTGYRMYSYVTRELPEVIARSFPAAEGRQGIFGHSMGGHGALVCALRNPHQYRSVSAFAPISNPSRVPWGEKALGRYLGQDREAWKSYDATALLEGGARTSPMLVDQGLADKFLEVQLQQERLEEAARRSGQPLTLRRHEGYDHGYFFIASFMEQHLRHHAEAL
jgi:S-formylglutathione hydrolase